MGVTRSCCLGLECPNISLKEDPKNYWRNENKYPNLKKLAQKYLSYQLCSVASERLFSTAGLIQNDLQDEFIIGDKAYPVTKWCIPPYIERGYVTTQQRNFNSVHASTRQIVERWFALLFGRLRRLRYLNMNRTDTIPATIIAACVLHNICLKNPHELLNTYIEEFSRNL
nr:unnamed protein product [Callosobruchus analis]